MAFSEQDKKDIREYTHRKLVSLEKDPWGEDGIEFLLDNFDTFKDMSIVRDFLQEEKIQQKAREIARLEALLEDLKEMPIDDWQMIGEK